MEASNLNRQVLYRSSDIGRPKAVAAAAHLRAINPHIRVSAEQLRVEAPADLLPLLKGCDLFVLGADQPHEIMLWANDVAEAIGTPWMENSYSGPRCAIALFVPGRTPCLRCLQHELVGRERRRGVFEGANLFPVDTSNSVIAPTAGIAGHYGALRALYFLTGLRPGGGRGSDPDRTSGSRRTSAWSGRSSGRGVPRVAADAHRVAPGHPGDRGLRRPAAPEVACARRGEASPMSSPPRTPPDLGDTLGGPRRVVA